MLHQPSQALAKSPQDPKGFTKIIPFAFVVIEKYHTGIKSKIGDRGRPCLGGMHSYYSQDI